MKYVVPITVEFEDASKLLGTLPRTATQTRVALATKIQQIIKDYKPSHVEKVEESPETVETIDAAPALKKSAKKGTKK